MRPFRIFSILPLLLLAGCFLVNDFGDYWKKGTVDPLLEGTWTDISSQKSITLVKHGDHYRYADLKDPTQIKTLKIGAATFLMIRGTTAHGLLRYRAAKDRVVVFGPNAVKRADFINNYATGSDSFRVEPQGVRIVKMSASTVKLLEMLAKDDSYWKEQVIFEKGKGLTDKALEKEKALESPAPDPFAEAREKYKDAIGKKKGGATQGVPPVIKDEKELEGPKAFQKMLQEGILKDYNAKQGKQPAPPAEGN